MFTKPLNYIITKESLKTAYDSINTKSSGIDDVSFREFEKDFTKNLETLVQRVVDGLFAPEPLKKIEIEKENSDEKRPLALSAIKDKLVQKVLYENLNPYFDKTFSDGSYAYRPDKSTLKALNRATDYLNRKNLIILKTDIDNYFESIDHDILLGILDKQIEDKRIIRLISLFMQVGGFMQMDYVEHRHGVYQGDILSPLLSNIYLDAMDKHLEANAIAFVRYADDFALFFTTKNQAYKSLKELKEFLKTLKLRLGEEKTSIVHISDGFSFLGVNFVGRNREVQAQRLQKNIQKIENFAKSKLPFYSYIEQLNAYLYALKNYYLKILTHNSPQHIELQNAVQNSLVHKIYLSKKSKAISTKIEKKKNHYAKKFANDSTLHIA